MGRITEVFYKEIDPIITNVEDAGEFYYHSNLIGVNEIFHSDYEEYETNQIKLKNKIVGDAISNGEIRSGVRPNSTTLALSSMKNKVVVLVDLN